jgi:hypothetical protein
MRKALLIHVESALKAIKRKRYFKSHVESNKIYMEQTSVIKQAKAHLAEHDNSINRKA